MSAVAVDRPKIGRPSYFNPEICQEICQRYARGESLLDISEDDHMPWRDVIWDWTQRHPSFANMLERARVLHCRVLMERALRKADRAHDSNSANAAKVYLGAATRWAQALDRDTWGAKEEREVTHYQRMDDNALKAKLIEKITSDPSILEAVQAVIAARAAKQITVNGDASTSINGDASRTTDHGPGATDHGPGATDHGPSDTVDDAGAALDAPRATDQATPHHPPTADGDAGE